MLTKPDRPTCLFILLKLIFYLYKNIIYIKHKKQEQPK